MDLPDAPLNEKRKVPFVTGLGVASILISNGSALGHSVGAKIVAANSSNPVITTTALQLSLRPIRPVVKANDPIIIDVVIRNPSDHEIGLLSVGGVFENYHITVRDPNGRSATPTDYGHLILPEGPENLMLNAVRNIQIEAGQERHQYVWLNRIYDMTLDGKYTISAEYGIRRSEVKNPVTLSSNTITIQVLPISDEDVAEEQLKTVGVNTADH